MNNNILKAIDIAKQNPDSPYATELRKRIETGLLDNELNSAGIAEKFGRPTIEKKPNLVERVKTNIQEKGQQVQEQISGTGEYANKNAIERGVGAAATTASGISSTFYEILPEGIRNTLDKVSGGIGKGVDYLSDKISNSKFLQEAVASGDTKQLESALQIVSDLGLISGEVLGADQAAKVATKATKTVKEVAPVIKEKITTKLETNKANRLKGDVEKLDKLVGQVIQGKPEDIAIAKRALKEIDVTDVEKYDDLKTVLSEKIDNTANALDAKLETNTKTTKLKDLGVTIEGGRAKFNYVKESLNQLSDYYAKTNNFTAKLEIDELAKKANKTGLTVKEINDLARKHGRDLNGFNANGELASGLNKQAAENTRKGLKKTARTIFGDKAYEAADAQLTDLINTKSLVDDMSTKVNTLQQKVTERGFGEKVGRLVFQVADKFTGGGLKGFVQSFIPRSAGLKTMNALDLEKALRGNLKQIDNIIKAGTEAEAEKALTKLLKPKTVNTVNVANPIDGTLVNVGLNIGDTVDALSQEKIINELAKRGVKVIESTIKKSDTENTLIAKLSRPLTKDELFDLSVDLEQDAIPQLSKGSGILTGPKAANWGDFNPEYFLGIDGQPIQKAIEIPTKKTPVKPKINKKDSQIKKTKEKINPNSEEFKDNSYETITKSIQKAKASGQSFNEWVKGQEIPKRDSVRLYRGMTKKFDKNFDLSKTDAPTGYSTWTDNKKLAEQYAGKDGFVYEIDLPKNKQGNELFDEIGDRVLFLDNEKKAGLNNISGKEYLIYNKHDLYNPNLIRESKTRSQLKAEWDKVKAKK
mgnify:CR=1 FL=1